MNRKCNNEVVKGCIDTLKRLTMDLAYGETSEEDFKTIVDINETLNILEDEVSGIEGIRDYHKANAELLRKKLYGENAIGIK